MSSQSQESFSASVFWDVESNSYNQDMVAYSGDVYPWPGTPMAFGRLPHSANRAYLADEALTMSPFDDSERHLDVPLMMSMHPFVIRPPIEAVTENAPEFPPLPMVSAPGDPVLSERCFWTVSSQEFPELPAVEPVEGYPCGTPPLPTCLGMNVPVEAMGAKPDTYDPRSYPGNFPHRPVHKGRKCGSPAHQMGERATRDHRCRVTCPVAGCGGNFSGQSEKNRHIRSKHRPPTIGCRRCNYKQSRKDLFSKHCKRHHPGESLEALIVRLITPSA
ncbi:hypothetical protein BJV78DRAFT_1179207 [Lactifluus subvellereus]|nr:hypothetical protein BJV78DRAFT_1179207 [Lactifluus subvellereus]